MRRLFTLLSSLALISSVASSVMACNDNIGATNPDSKFNLWNLSTWGDKQKQVIVKSYLKSAKGWYDPTDPDQQHSTWSDWTTNYYQQSAQEPYAINTAFDLVNSAFDTKYVAYSYQPIPSGDLKQDLAKGVNLIMNSLRSGAFTGELTMTIKGEI